MGTVRGTLEVLSSGKVGGHTEIVEDGDGRRETCALVRGPVPADVRRHKSVLNYCNKRKINKNINGN